jgi:signal peptidase I
MMDFEPTIGSENLQGKILFEVFVLEDGQYKYYTSIYKNALISRIIPNIGDHIIIDKNKLKVDERLINYNINITRIFVEKIEDNK